MNDDSEVASVLELQRVERTHIVLGMLCFAFIWTATVQGMLPLEITEEILHCK